MTGWLVAIIGFNVNIKAFALPAIGIGMLMTLLIKQGRYPALGKVIAGFGLFFLGVDLMKSGFSGMEDSIMLDTLQQGGLSSLIIFVAVGFMMTLVMQSSSAAIAMTLTAAAGNVIALPAAACMVIGANVGTTSTAAMAAIGATPNARRVAAGHVIFNLITGVVALLILPLLLVGIEWFQQNSGMESGPATFLALFHTIFNLLGVLLLWPFTKRLVAFLKQRFVAEEEDEARPKYLDNTLIDTPMLAHKALAQELARIQAISIRMAEDAINTEASLSPRLVVDRYVLNKLTDAVGNFSSRLRSTDLPDEVAESLPKALASARYFIDVAELAGEIDQKQSSEVSDVTKKLEGVLAEMRRLSISALEMTKQAEAYEEIAEQEVDILDRLGQDYESVKTQLLRAGTMGEITVRHMVALIELMKNIERLVSHSVKGQRLLHDFIESLSSADEKAPDESPDVEDDDSDEH
jgi:phosphate:Na+ symporter